ncbi:hypothetical protein [Clostridium botulinum]|uniref:hypothetical protein n=1 Tax=Clostridium botulinum TaxID=1491 RepID=UPI001969E3C5|nr:hypothetical protein [Clostridium botulinum]
MNKPIQKVATFSSSGDCDTKASEGCKTWAIGNRSYVEDDFIISGTDTKGEGLCRGA